MSERPDADAERQRITKQRKARHGQRATRLRTEEKLVEQGGRNFGRRRRVESDRQQG